MSRKLLGLSFSPRSILVAELSADGKSVQLVKHGEFDLPVAEAAPAGKSDAKPAPPPTPAEIGKKFGEFLKAGAFSTRSACIGIPTQWLMLKEKSLPFVGVDNLGGILALQSERDFSLEPEQLILDYTSAPQTGADGKPAISVLLAAALRERVNACVAIAEGAGLTARMGTASAIELAQAAGAPILIHAGPFGADMVVRNRAGLSIPVVLSSSAPGENANSWAAAAGTEAKRVLTLRAGIDAGFDADAPVALWNGAGLSDSAVKALSEALGRGVLVLKALTVSEINGLSSVPRMAMAAAVARRGISPEAPGLNFLNSKLVEKKASGFERFKSWRSVAALAGVVALGALAYSWISDTRELGKLKAQSIARKTEVDAAKAFLARYDSAQGWYDKRPNILECMKELSSVIKVDDDYRARAWISNLNVKEDFHCTVAMKAIDKDAYFQVFDAIEKNEAFREVKLLYMTQPDKKKSEVAFAVNFVYWKAQ